MICPSVKFLVEACSVPSFCKPLESEQHYKYQSKRYKSLLYLFCSLILFMLFLLKFLK